MTTPKAKRLQEKILLNERSIRARMLIEYNRAFIRPVRPINKIVFSILCEELDRVDARLQVLHGRCIDITQAN